MRMQRKKFRIGELAKQLALEKFVIRFWEKEFNLKSSRSDGGQRFYNEKDLALFETIKTLLYEEGFTISGARKYIETKQKRHPLIGSHKTSFEEIEVPKKHPTHDQELHNELKNLKKKLISLQKLL